MGTNERHGKLVDQLNDIYSDIVARYAKRPRQDKDLAVFLMQSVFMNADDDTLERMLKDAQEHIQILEEYPEA